MTTFQGVDASLSQGNIDWLRVRSFHNNFAMLRATVGWGRPEIQTDSSFHRNIHDAAQAGLMVGAYHSSVASNANEAHCEAEGFLHAIGGYKLAYPVAIDIETRPLRCLSNDQLDEIIKAWCGDISNAGYYPMIRAQLTTVIRRLRPETLKTYGLWLQYPSNKIDYDGEVGIWQYTSVGNVGGVRGRIGKNYAFLDYPKIMLERGLGGFAPPVVAAPTWDTSSLLSCSSSLIQALNAFSGLAALIDIIDTLAQYCDTLGILDNNDGEVGQQDIPQEQKPKIQDAKQDTATDDEVTEQARKQDIIEDTQTEELYPEISEKLEKALNEPIIIKAPPPPPPENIQSTEDFNEQDEAHL